MPPINVAPNLYLIDLDQNLPGFSGFIASWLFTGKKNFLVDVGPAASVAVLVNALKSLGIRHLEAILLTHIHIDHAGGSGDLIRHFPGTPVVCHQSAIPHLVDPLRLWEGSLKTLGETARAYGPFQPVPPERLCNAAEFRHPDVEPILTPGHAPHHVSYFLDPYLFAGEAGGVHIDIPGGDVYLRPATPPRFFLETYTQSMESLLSRQPAAICYGHYGLHTDPVAMLSRHRDQLLLWKKIIAEEIQPTLQKDFLDVCVTRLLNEDPCLKGFSRMKPPVQARELDFIKNSIRGFVDHLSRESASS